MELPQELILNLLSQPVMVVRHVMPAQIVPNASIVRQAEVVGLVLQRRFKVCSDQAEKLGGIK